MLSGEVSPVTMDRSSNRQLPVTTVPSTGRRSPATTRTVSPARSDWTSRNSRLPSGASTVAPRGIIRARERTASRARPRIAWSAVRPASRKNSSEVTASK